MIDEEANESRHFAIKHARIARSATQESCTSNAAACSRR